MNDNTNRKPIPVEDMDRETLATRLALALGQPFRQWRRRRQDRPRNS